MGNTTVREYAKAQQDKKLSYNAQVLQLDLFFIEIAKKMTDDLKTFDQTNIQKNIGVTSN